jgi:hypothetical protein
MDKSHVITKIIDVFLFAAKIEHYAEELIFLQIISSAKIIIPMIQFFTLLVWNRSWAVLSEKLA